MEKSVALPVCNENGYFEIRLESIGGLGANLGGKLMGELGANYLGLNSVSFSSYGSEKRGSPVKAFIRWSDPSLDIRLNSPIEKPHILGLFHENLAGKQDVIAGVGEKTKVVVNTSKTPEEMRDKLKIAACEMACVDALKIAMEKNTRINMVMLGAIAKVSGFIPIDRVIDMVKDTMGKKYPKLVESNVAGIMGGYESVKSQFIADDGKYSYQQYEELKGNWGYKNAPIGGVNPLFGSTVSNDVSGSREGYIPVFIKEKCINCGLCDTTCPDMVYQFVEGEYRGKKAMVNAGPDYKHCKGCLRCVEICPTNALVEGLERDYDVSSMHVRNKDLIVEHMDFDEVGANSWVTSESFSEEKHVNEKEVR